jgi:predicted unusual protein kinase regulating ubiquinone biosynthesis (AarF/ABC1/UbiB family)
MKLGLALSVLLLTTSNGWITTKLPSIRQKASSIPLTELFATIEKTAQDVGTSDLSHSELILSEKMFKEIELEADKVVQELLDEECEFDEQTGLAVDEVCMDDEKKAGFRQTLKGYVVNTLNLVRSSSDDATPDEDEGLAPGEILERGWEQRANSSAIRRNAEVWKLALSCVFRVLKPRKLRAKGASEKEILEAQQDAADFINDSLLKLGPSFVKLGQVASTRTDVLARVYTDSLRKLTDEVPGFSGMRAKQIISDELGKPFDKVFDSFSDEPLKAASLGQVHTAYYKGQKVAIKVQRAGLKELFDIDLKNLKKLAALLDKFDPKTDGADRNWVSIYEESERLLYLEIDYLNEVRNTERFAKDFKDCDWVKIPNVIKEVTTPRVLTMEFVESFKLTDVKRIEKLGLDRKLLSERVGNWFLRQIIETGFFHADPHSGNLCVNEQGQLVVYDYGLMDELKPNVKKGFRTFCTALFAGGPKISDIQLAKNAKDLVTGVEQAGVLDKKADRLAVEKLARFFMRTFKDNQLGKRGANIKETVGPDLQTLTENNVFRFPSTFTFIFRAFASIDGIGKELNSDFDIGKLAQPFVEKFIDAQKGYDSQAEKNLSIFSRATGLNKDDIETAISQPRKVAYVEQTLRSIEEGSLKIRVRSLENEKALERMDLRQGVMQNALFATLCLNMAGLASRGILRNAGVAGAAFFIFQTLISKQKITKFDKTQLKYITSGFTEENETITDE